MKELADERLSGRAKKGLSVDDEKQQKARRREYVMLEDPLPERVPHLLEKGCDKVAYDLLKQLADGPRRPAELRAALGITSANFFTARYLTPLAKAGYTYPLRIRGASIRRGSGIVCWQRGGVSCDESTPPLLLHH